MSTVLVSIRINALLLEHPKTVMNALADFNKLPWSNKEHDFNASTPYLAESVLFNPFQNNDLTLSPGVHLHWELPKCFRNYSAEAVNGVQKQPPAVPNRWLVTRRNQDGIDESWVVESDFLSPTQSLENANAITIPIDPKQTNASVDFNGQPFLYMGRQVPLEKWLAEPVSEKRTYWKDVMGTPLTAFGYGELSFSTFYPNCHSVFGFYDPQSETKGSSYQVLGWYSESDQDVLNQSLKKLQNLIERPNQNINLLAKLFNDSEGCPEWIEHLMADEQAIANWPQGAPKDPNQYLQLKELIGSEHPGWLKTILDLSIRGTQSFIRFGLEKLLKWKWQGREAPSENEPGSSLFYGEIAEEHVRHSEGTAPLFNHVAIGNTTAEALSAYLGQSLNNGHEKQVIEEQLAAILQGDRFSQGQADQKAHFQKLRHQEGFTTIEGGRLWHIRKKIAKHNDAQRSPTEKQSSLPVGLSDLLRNLNEVQEDHDRATWKLEILEQELYSDWCKFMSACYPPEGEQQNYPDVDQMVQYVKYLASEVDRVAALLGKIGFDPRLEESTSKPKDTPEGELDLRIANAYQELYNALAQDQTHTLEPVSAPRFYHPKDPVLLFAGESKGHNQLTDTSTGTTALVLASLLPNASTHRPNPKLWLQTVNTLETSGSFSSGVYSWSPQILEWLTAFFPARSQNHLNSHIEWSENFINESFTLSNDVFDFKQKDHSISVSNTYSGFTYVATGAKDQLQKVLESFIKRQYGKVINTPSFAEDLNKIWKHPDYATQAQNWTNPGYTAVKAWQHLQNQIILTQNIGGFHEALQQQGHSEQLPIQDPLGFAEYQDLTKHVRKTLQNKRLQVPSPSSYFFPVRAGGLRPMQMALSDHFGIGTLIDEPNTITPQLYTASERLGWMWLPPRITQPAQLRFRWLANGRADAGEVNSHIASSPVCGWVMPNYLDNSLAIYNSNGKALGSFDADSNDFRPFPGADHSFVGDDIQPQNPKNINDRLLRVMLWIKGLGKKLSSFIDDLQRSQDQVCPEKEPGDHTLALLMGRPMAIVRAKLSLEAKGGLLHDEGWVPFEYELAGNGPETHGYEHVKFPVELGDADQLNDGLIAHWLENESGELEGETQLTINRKASLHLSLANDPVYATMLLDPEGCVHASCGILPVKSVSIPEEQVQAALKRLEVSFFSAPVLSPQNGLQLSLPQEQGYHWNWVQKQKDGWTRIPNLPVIRKADFETAWQAYLTQKADIQPPQGSAWDELVAHGWLKPLAGYNNLWQVIAAENKERKALQDWKEHAKELQVLLYQNLCGISGYDTNARFHQKQELREGWLTLTPNSH